MERDETAKKVFMERKEIVKGKNEFETMKKRIMKCLILCVYACSRGVDVDSDRRFSL